MSDGSANSPLWVMSRSASESPIDETPAPAASSLYDQQMPREGTTHPQRAYFEDAQDEDAVIKRSSDQADKSQSDNLVRQFHNLDIFSGLTDFASLYTLKRSSSTNRMNLGKSEIVRRKLSIGTDIVILAVTNDLIALAIGGDRSVLDMTSDQSALAMIGHTIALAMRGNQSTFTMISDLLALAL